MDSESLGVLATEVSGREIDREAEKSLWNVAQTFGNRAVLRLLLIDASSSDELDKAAIRPQP